MRSRPWIWWGAALALLVAGAGWLLVEWQSQQPQNLPPIQPRHIPYRPPETFEKFQFVPGEVMTLAWSEDARFLLYGLLTGEVGAWSRERRDTSRIQDPDGEAVTRVIYAPNKKGYAWGNLKGELFIRPPRGGEPQQIKVTTGKREVTDLAYTPDGEYIVTTSRGGSVSWWESKSGRLIARAKHGTNAYAVAISPDGHYGFTAGDDKKIRVWNAKTHQLAKSWYTGNHVLSLATCPGFIVSGDRLGYVGLWTEQGEERWRTQGHYGFINSVTASTDGATVVSSDQDGYVRVWNPGSHIPAKEFSTELPNKPAFPVTSVSLSRDGLLAVGSGRGVQIWDLNK